MSRGSLSFSSKFSNNCVVIIDALGPSDLQTARRLSEDVGAIAAAADRPGYCRYLRVESSTELLAALLEILEQAKLGLRPILHIEAHGDKENGIEIGATREMVPWSTIHAAFLAINKATGNNLGVVLAACFGLYAIEPLRIANPSPFYFLIGPDKSIDAGYIDEAMCRFYSALLATNSLDAAMAEASEFKQFHCEHFFYLMFAKYMKKVCMGSAAGKRVENLVSKAVKHGVFPNSENLRMLRARAKAHVRNPEQIFERRAKHFLHGRKAVAFKELESFVKGDG